MDVRAATAEMVLDFVRGNSSWRELEKSVIYVEIKGDGCEIDNPWPADNNCAPILVYWENGGDIVYLTLGRNTLLEVPVQGHRYTLLEGLQELLSIIRAVVEGRFVETLWEKSARIVRRAATVGSQA